VYITAERCLCITAPLAVRNIITPKRATLSLIAIYIINISILVPPFTTSYIGWKFFPDLNRSLFGAITTSDYEQTEGLVFLIHAVIILTTFICVIVLTFVLVIKLKVASKCPYVGGRVKEVLVIQFPKSRNRGQLFLHPK
jgi:hypothetical protein